MNVVMIGDKSRYQVFRTLVDTSCQKEKNSGFNTEKLGTEDVYVVSEKKLLNQNVYFSSKLPLATTLFFPKEGSSLDISFNSNDKLVVFDEFPYRTQEEIEILRNFLNKNNVVYCEIVLVQNNRTFLESDITTEQMALNEAMDIYNKEKLCVKPYVIGKNFDFLFWECNYDILSNSMMLKKRIANVYERISVEFDIDYELEYLMELELYCSNRKVLDSFFAFEQCKNSKNVLKRYVQNSTSYFWGSMDNIYVQFVKNLYYKYMEEIAIWNINKDFSLLYKDVNEKFAEYVGDSKSIGFTGEIDNLEVWLNNNMDSVLTIKNRVIEFFKNELPHIIKNQMNNRLKKLEDLLNEEKD